MRADIGHAAVLVTEGRALGGGAGACPMAWANLGPYVPLGPLDISPAGFQSQEFWKLISPAPVPKVEVPNVGHESLIPQRVALCL